MKKIIPLSTLGVILMAASLALVFAGDQSFAQSKEKKSKKSGWLGVSIQAVTKDLVKEHDLKVSEGMFVEEVVDDSPADSAGIEDGDVIVSFDGKNVTDVDAFVKLVQQTAPGKKVPIALMRGSERKTVSAVIAAGSPEASVVKRMYMGSVPPVPPVPGVQKALSVVMEGGAGAYGMTLQALKPQLGEYFGAPDNKGVLVTEVKEDGKAAKAGFKAGDVIIRAGNKTVEKTRDFSRAFQAYDEGDQVPVEILRKGTKMTLNLVAEEADENDMLMNFFGDGSGVKWDVGKSGKAFMFRGGDLDDCDIDVDCDVDVDLDDLGEHMRALKVYIDKSTGKAKVEMEKAGKDMERAKKDLQKANEELEKKIRIKVKKSLKEVDEI